MAKVSIEKLPGVYHLNDVRETASGFKLEQDQTFRFFFTYGALDRYGSGSWQLENNEVVFRSRPWSGQDFSLVRQGRIPQQVIGIRLVNINPVLKSHVFFSLQDGKPGTWVQADQNGELVFPLQPFTSITIVFEYCQERFTRIAVPEEGLNFFEFAPEAWLMEVFFNDFRLQATRYALTGGHPLIQGKQFVYEKS